MKIRIVAVGNVFGAERELCDEYLGRMKRYAKVEELEVKAGQPTGKEVAAIARAAGEANLVVLEEQGTALSSTKFARRLEVLASRGKGDVAFVIGGAYGFPKVFSPGAERWSLSPLTFPHRLARVILCEQLYRAMTILRGAPYHH